MTMGLAEWIIDGTCIVFAVLAEKQHTSITTQLLLFFLSSCSRNNQEFLFRLSTPATSM